jgi:hypothetical protein
MGNKEKKIESFLAKYHNGPTKLNGLICYEAVLLLRDDVNPDKVQNWADNVLSTFNNKPKPLTEKEKLKKEEAKTRKVEKAELFVSLNDKMSTLFKMYGVVKIGFFNYHEVYDADYKLMQKVAKDKGLFLKNVGDGAVELYLSKTAIDKSFLNKLNTLQDELHSFCKETVLDKTRTFSLNEFKNELISL